MDGIVIVLAGLGIASDDLRELWVGKTFKQIVQIEVEAVVQIWPVLKKPRQLERALDRRPAGLIENVSGDSKCTLQVTFVTKQRLPCGLTAL